MIRWLRNNKGTEGGIRKIYVEKRQTFLRLLLKKSTYFLYTIRTSTVRDTDSFEHSPDTHKASRSVSQGCNLRLNTPKFYNEF